jgi:hypothetical protein
LLEGKLMEAAAVGLRQERLAPEHQPHQLEEVVAPIPIAGEERGPRRGAKLALRARQPERPGEVDFEILLKAR